MQRHNKKIPDDTDLSDLKTKVPEGVLAWCREFYVCDSCGKIYWKGSHYEKLQRIVNRIMNK